MNRRNFLTLFVATTAGLAVSKVLPVDTSTKSVALVKSGLYRNEFLWAMAGNFSIFANNILCHFQIPKKMIFGDSDISQEGYYDSLSRDYENHFGKLRSF